MNLVETDAEVAKCPNCGANTTFEPLTQTLQCDYCDTVIDFKKAFANEKISIQNLLTAYTPWEGETTVFRCDNCGAMEVLSKTEISKDCPYCHASSVVKTNELSGLKPHAVVPFAVSVEYAGKYAEQWVKKRAFTPNTFKRTFSPKNLRGIYNPAFTFDSQTFSSYSGRLGRHETRTRTVRRNGRTETETYTVTIWFNIRGNYSDAFSDIVIQASTAIAQTTLDQLAPFGIQSAADYSPNYLFGFSANQYNKDGMHCWEDARKVIDREIYRGILSRYYYDVVGHIDIHTTCNNVKFKYLLLPIYVGASKYKKRLYNYFVNGVSGKVTGKTPKSIAKILMAIFIPLGIIGIGFLIWWIMNR